jgi:hypothetical protein
MENRATRVRRFPSCLKHALIVVHDRTQVAHSMYVFGEVDAAAARELESEFNDIPPRGLVVIELSDCTYLCAEAIAVLTRAAQRLEGRLQIAASSETCVGKLLGAHGVLGPLQIVSPGEPVRLSIVP